MVKKGDIYKNYIELCKAMGETPTSGNGKRTQEKRWGRLFKYHKTGQKYVVEKVYEQELKKEDRRGGNHKPNIDVFMPYVSNRLVTKGRRGWFGTQWLMSDLLGLIPKEVYDQLNEEETSREKFIEMYGLESYGSFVSFTHAYETVVRETFSGCLNRLMKEGCVKWMPGHMFKIDGPGGTYVNTTELEKLIDLFEKAACQRLGSKYHFKGKGRQILWFMHNNPWIMKEYYAVVLKWLLNEESVKQELATASKGKIDPELTVFGGYYKGMYIQSLDKTKIKQKAPPDEDKTKILENIFTRIEKRVSIPKCDFENLKTLFYTVIN